VYHLVYDLLIITMIMVGPHKKTQVLVSPATGAADADLAAFTPVRWSEQPLNRE
jgi:hypothetical protein